MESCALVVSPGHDVATAFNPVLGHGRLAYGMERKRRRTSRSYPTARGFRIKAQREYLRSVGDFLERGIKNNPDKPELYEVARPASPTEIQRNHAQRLGVLCESSGPARRTGYDKRFAAYELSYCGGAGVRSLSNGSNDLRHGRTRTNASADRADEVSRNEARYSSQQRANSPRRPLEATSHRLIGLPLKRTLSVLTLQLCNPLNFLRSMRFRRSSVTSMPISRRSKLFWPMRNERKCTHFVCLGDVVGYNANPHECVERVRTMDCPIVKGNHDEQASLAESSRDFNELAEHAIAWTRDHLSRRTRNGWASCGCKVRCAISRSCMPPSMLPKDGAMSSTISTPPRASRYQQTTVCFFGHTHVPMAFVRDDGVKRREDRSPSDRAEQKIFH